MDASHLCFSDDAVVFVCRRLIQKKGIRPFGLDVHWLTIDPRYSEQAASKQRGEESPTERQSSVLRWSGWN